MKDKKTKKKIMREREIYFHWTTAIQPKSFRAHVLHEERERESESHNSHEGFGRGGFWGFFSYLWRTPWDGLYYMWQSRSLFQMGWTEPTQLLILIKRCFSGTVGHQINVTRLSMHISLLPNMRSGCFFCIEHKLEKRKKKKKKKVSNFHLAERWVRK